jgi:hypothetical protein
MLAFGYPGLVLVKPTGGLGGRDPCPSKTQGLCMFFDFFTDVCPASGQGRDECFVEGTAVVFGLLATPASAASFGGRGGG